MSNPSDPIDTTGAVDLADVKARADARVAAAEEVAQQEAEQARLRDIMARAESWDKAMQRAFKGIMPRHVRHRYLRRGVEA